MKFSDLGLPEVLVQELTKQNIVTPTPIQEKTIPVALTRKDVMGSAQTGTGKTLAFSIPTVMHLLACTNDRALVLLPTRELAVQVHSVLNSLLKAVDLPEACLLIGGVAFGPQFGALRKNPRVIVATPGRLIDHLRNGKSEMRQVTTLVLDEADRMLDMGFLPQVRKILEFIPKERQTLFFTATFPKEIVALTKDILRNPEKIFVDPPTTANKLVEQKSVDATQANKRDLLLDAINEAGGSALIFTRTKRRTDTVARSLVEYGVAVDRIHGDRSQSQRQKAITDFRSGRCKVLVATDIAARGLDIPQVSLVVNFDLPESKEDYVHRIGRTGRAGASGLAVSFVLAEESRHWQDISGKKHQRSQTANVGEEEASLTEDRAPARPSQRNSQPRRSFNNSRDQRGGGGRFSRSNDRFGGEKKFAPRTEARRDFAAAPAGPRRERSDFSQPRFSEPRREGGFRGGDRQDSRQEQAPRDGFRKPRFAGPEGERGMERKPRFETKKPFGGRPSGESRPFPRREERAEFAPKKERFNGPRAEGRF